MASARAVSRATTFTIIEFVRQRTDKRHARLLTVFDRLRRKRNTALYDDTGFVSQRDAEEAIATARKYLDVIHGDIAGRKPRLNLPTVRRQNSSRLRTGQADAPKPQRLCGSATVPRAGRPSPN